MKTLSLALTLALATAAGATQAATMEHDMARHPMVAQAASSAEGIGVIKELDATGKRIKIAHGPINALHWPPMTMWFAVRNPLPQDIKVGDTVRFELTQSAADQWVIVKIERR